MRRSIIFGLCIFNAIIACALLWYLLGAPNRSVKQAERTRMEQAPESLTDPQLWQKAMNGHSHRESLHYLNRIQEATYLLEQAELHLRELKAGEVPAFEQWPFVQAVIDIYGTHSSKAPDLHLLCDIASSPPLPLSIRDRAFRSLIESAARFDGKDTPTEAIFDLIDATYAEPNSLSETSLQAEAFLSRHGIEREAPTEKYKMRLIAVLKDSSQPTSERIIALNILEARNAIQIADLSQIYASADRPLQTAILKQISRSEESTSLEWLQGVRPTTPEQEQLIHIILD